MGSSVVAPFLTPLALGLLSGVLLLIAFAWRYLTSTRAPAPLCPKCLYNVESIGREPRCPECGTDLQRTGIIAPGTRTRKRIPFPIVAAAATGFSLVLAGLAGSLCRSLRVLQDESQTFQVVLTNGDPQRNIAAMWWYSSKPFAEPIEVVKIEAFAFPGNIIQYYHRGVPARWVRDPVTAATTSGTGPVPISEVWALIGAGNLSPDDPAHAAMVDSLRHVLISGQALDPPTGKGWTPTQPFGPTREYSASILLIVLVAIGTVVIVVMTIIALYHRRYYGYQIVAKRTPIPA